MKLQVVVLTTLLLPACAIAPAEPPPDPAVVAAADPALSTAPAAPPVVASPRHRPSTELHRSLPPITQGSDLATHVRPSALVLPDNEVGVAVRALIHAREELGAEEAASARGQAESFIKARPMESMAAFDRALDALPEGDWVNRWQLAAALAPLGLDEALPTLSKIAARPIPAVPMVTKANGQTGAPGPAITAALRGTLTTCTSIDGIAKIARTTTIAATKTSANSQLVSYFTHPERMVKEYAVIGYLREGNTQAARDFVNSKLAPADRYMTTLRWEKSPATTTTIMPAKPAKLATDTGAGIAVPKYTKKNPGFTTETRGDQ